MTMAKLELSEVLSPNHDERPAGQPIDILLLHYTGMKGAQAAIDRLVDPKAKVSAHYLIEEDGTPWRLVAEERRAWHAGVSYWEGSRDINARSIGIELVNPGHEFGYRPFPPAQMDSLEALALEILARHPITPRHVLGHSDVAPPRKQDPGELFDWAGLARHGIGLWPRASATPRSWSVAEFQSGLGRFGYEVPTHGQLDEATKTVLIAFQRHFRPSRFDGAPDDECAGILADLLDQIG
ncbi:N-acetylmuramoyl-L-alanine amidase [Hypericibacter terrae]|uniref:N-acetylmuramoyl-L-alanine amidase n=2 Tax=Hypericibacter terrae TaxID=2602015 RepID=A0A5J6MEH0_9PROT|nr:N-acetylmuramoyl-L-alanine amidase [Hypericibacter terrae]